MISGLSMGRFFSSSILMEARGLFEESSLFDFSFI